MTTLSKLLKTIALIALVTSHTTHAANESTSKLLTVDFEARQVVKIEAGDFHFVPGQAAPIHTHAAPAIGYVAKGQILYQVEGEKPQLLNEGEAFYEPAGPRILRFDNASATEEAIFIDFNLQRKGDPFIVFEQELTEAIDRRTLPTLDVDNKKFKRVNVFVSELEPKGQKTLNHKDITLAYIAEGIVNLDNGDGTKLRFKAGETFTLPAGKSAVNVDNVSSDVPAKIVAFYLQ